MVHWEWINNMKGIKVTSLNEKKGSSYPFQKLFKGNSSVKDNGQIECEIKQLKYDELILEFEDEGDAYRMEFKNNKNAREYEYDLRY